MATERTGPRPQAAGPAPGTDSDRSGRGSGASSGRRLRSGPRVGGERVRARSGPRAGSGPARAGWCWLVFRPARTIRHVFCGRAGCAGCAGWCLYPAATVACESGGPTTTGGHALRIRVSRGQNTNQHNQHNQHRQPKKALEPRAGLKTNRHNRHATSTDRT